MNLNDIAVVENEGARQFEMRINGKLAKVEYMMGGGRMFLTNVDVPAQLEGKGVDQALVERVFEIIADRKLKMVPLCAYVTTFMRQHPQWKKLLAHGIHV
ncbi:N-acetyltransferase [Chitinophaga horti]|uniref:N-acetyltransferase n=1 Tax=Chitinophaga horti TaxID=2920382 RepID=A0ABY6IY04_9BACT|nr:GNAT family N-acetyltransferase [Chitinophaga horti]UYQ91031.1 N-acetyltransferase [Chitinophaga horti]